MPCPPLYEHPPSSLPQVIDGGALIVYTHDSKGIENIVFHTHTTGGAVLRYAQDGALTLVDADTTPLWSAPTASKGLGGPGTVAVDDAGALCVTDSTGANVWTSAGGAWAQAKANAAALADVASQAAAAALDAGKAAAAAAVGAGKAAVARVTTAPGVGDAVAQAKEGV